MWRRHRSDFKAMDFRVGADVGAFKPPSSPPPECGVPGCANTGSERTDSDVRGVPRGRYIGSWRRFSDTDARRQTAEKTGAICGHAAVTVTPEPRGARNPGRSADIPAAGCGPFPPFRTWLYLCACNGRVCPTCRHTRVPIRRAVSVVRRRKDGTRVTPIPGPGGNWSC